MISNLETFIKTKVIHKSMSKLFVQNPTMNSVHDQTFGKYCNAEMNVIANKHILHEPKQLITIYLS